MFLVEYKSKLKDKPFRLERLEHSSYTVTLTAGIRIADYILLRLLLFFYCRLLLKCYSKGNWDGEDMQIFFLGSCQYCMSFVNWFRSYISHNNLGFYQFDSFLDYAFLKESSSENLSFLGSSFKWKLYTRYGLLIHLLIPQRVNVFKTTVFTAWCITVKCIMSTILSCLHLNHPIHGYLTIPVCGAITPSGKFNLFH